jgi:hypothetical protein
MSEFRGRHQAAASRRGHPRSAILASSNAQAAGAEAIQEVPVANAYHLPAPRPETRVLNRSPRAPRTDPELWIHDHADADDPHPVRRTTGDTLVVVAERILDVARTELRRRAEDVG